MVALEEYEEAIKYLSEPSSLSLPEGQSVSGPPVDKGHLALLKTAKEGLLRNKKQDQEVWGGRLQTQDSTPLSSEGEESSSETFSHSRQKMVPLSRSRNTFLQRPMDLIALGIAVVIVVVAYLYRKELIT